MITFQHNYLNNFKVQYKNNMAYAYNMQYINFIQKSNHNYNNK